MSCRSRPAERLLERVGLLLVAREAVEQEAVARVAVADALGDHADDHLVGHELAGVHVALGLAPELGALGDLRAQDVAGGDVRQPEVVAQAIGLGALSGARRAEQDQVQLGHDASSLSARRVPMSVYRQRGYRPGRGAQRPTRADCQAKPSVGGRREVAAARGRRSAT